MSRDFAEKFPSFASIPINATIGNEQVYALVDEFQ
jgi:hypothetical protein